MNRIVLFIVSWMLCFVSVAQETSVGATQDESDKIIRVEFKSNTRNGDTIHVNIGYTFGLLSGVFFKRLSENVIKIPSAAYKDRFLTYDGGEIVRYTIEKESSFSGTICIKDIDLLVKPTDRKVTLTVTSKTNELLGTIDILITPEITLYMKINKEMVELNSSLPIPIFKEEDVVSIVAITDKGEELTTKECYALKRNRPMGRDRITNGGEFAIEDKQAILNPGRGIYIGGHFVDKYGVSWRKYVLWEFE